MNLHRRAPSSPHTDGRALATFVAAWMLIAVVIAVVAILLLHAS